MQAKKPIDLGYGIHLIDGFDLGLPFRTGTYIFDEEELTLIETGPGPSVPYIKQGLKDLDFSLEQVKYIILTHIHLDHAGGAGLLLKECPNAKVVVHPRGARHLTDPGKLIAGARAVYGEKFDELFGSIVPIPEERLLIKGEGDTLVISSHRTLEFIDTPGHAKHHFSIFDPVSNGMFTGDTAGIHYKWLEEDGVDFFLPTTSPNHFDPEAMVNSISRFRKYELDRLYFGHFGMTEKIDEVFRQVTEWIPIFVKEGEKALESGKDIRDLANSLRNRVSQHLKQFKISDNHKVFKVIELDLQVSAMGVIDYLQKKQSLKK
ncbi:MBL fold metallo-hydrolase [Scopulibacillus cellulosilyticus]|uniref:MBL fold metallo-hydrolase n=1 Tax=Scopulibacillus cellulosilyticus TaxID=2665665 RepID=A0ABW2PXN6_9BACL